MKNYLSDFITYYFNELVIDPNFHNKMHFTVEDSPWHREGNVLIHTNMVVANYIALCNGQMNKNSLLGAFACAFHDLGKPAAEEIRIRDDGIKYRRYAGHEIISARLWEDYAISNYDRLSELFDINQNDIQKVTFAIEHHLPYGMKKPHKLQNLMASIQNTVGSSTFFRMLKADCWGRISDDHDDKKANVIDWIESFMVTKSAPVNVDMDAPIMFVPIGASGSGKSTFTREMQEQNQAIEVFSLDEQRIKMHGDPNEVDLKKQYREAYEAANESKTFKRDVDGVFEDMVRRNVDIIIDNVNASAKSRRKFISFARQKGYRIIAITFPISLAQLEERHNTRDDKYVPFGAVSRQYMSLSQPQIGEFDEIIVRSTF